MVHAYYIVSKNLACILLTSHYIWEDLGDILKVPLSALELPVDLLVAGPPCPPWAGQGNHQAMNDPRAKVFVQVILWIIHLAYCGGLLCFIVENVPGVLNSHHGLETTMDKFVRILRVAIPFFVVKVDMLRLVDYRSPQTRVRVFLRGIRTCVVAEVPPCLSPWGASRLQDFLGNFPHTHRESFSQQQQDNIRAYEIKIRQLVQQGRLSPHDIVAIHPDRQDGLTYPQHMTVNKYPTMTTQNGDTMLLSVDDVVAATPDSQRRVFRVLQATERLTIAGFPAKLVEHLGVKLTMKATGNAYPPALIIATLAPLLRALSTMDLTQWPPADLPTNVPGGLLDRAKRLLKARGRIVDKAKYERWKKASQKKRKRSSSSSD